MDKELFNLAVQAAMQVPVPNSIGILSEYKTHSALKYYVCPDIECHEIKFMNFVCDAVTKETVFEVQSKSFERLRRKLEKILPTKPVTVVYPVFAEKTIYLTDTESGECTKRKSPKKENLYTVIPELYKISNYISDKNFILRLIFLGISEYRIKKETIPKKRHRFPPKNYEKYEKIPNEIFDDMVFSEISDYMKFIPTGLPDFFTSADFAEKAKIKRDMASETLHLLTKIGLTCRVDRKKEGYIYKITEK